MVLLGRRPVQGGESSQDGRHRCPRSVNHKKGRHSTEAPDLEAQISVGKAMQTAAGRENGRAFYPLGSHTDVVYPVDGGMEVARRGGAGRPLHRAAGVSRKCIATN